MRRIVKLFRRMFGRDARAMLWVPLFGGLAALSGCTTSNRPSAAEVSAAESAGGLGRLVDLDGHPCDLWKQPPSLVTVAVFTRSDCPISNRFAPEIRSLYERFHGQGVEFFQIYVDPDETPDAIRRHLRDFRSPCTGLRDPNHLLVAACGATITPEAVVFDRAHAMTYRGRISDLYVELGQPRAEANVHDLALAIEATLAGRAIAVPRTQAVGCTIADLEH